MKPNFTSYAKSAQIGCEPDGTAVDLKFHPFVVEAHELKNPRLEGADVNRIFHRAIATSSVLP